MRRRGMWRASVGFMVGGNGAILTASAIARRTAAGDAAMAVWGVNHLRAVDRSVWRGSAPTRDAYAALAARGVRTVVDLRAEADVRDNAFLAELGVELVRIPIRDGQTPSPEEVDRFIEAARSCEGIVFVHCGAGVGRTGTMAAAYLVGSRQVTPAAALVRNLAVGPPSLEQIIFVATLGHGLTRPNLAVQAVSRTLDAPRRLWSRLRHLTPRGAPWRRSLRGA